MEAIGVEELCRRYEQVYVAAVSDALDAAGYWHQALDSGLQPLNCGTKLAGPAFTMFGGPNRTTDKSLRKSPQAVDQLAPFSVVVMGTSGDPITGHWGELLTNAAMYRKCRGAVVDGGVRDTASIRALGFPIYYRFRSPRDASGRWNLIDYQCPIEAGGVLITPGDFIVGDDDGIVVVPRELVVDVLLEAEAIVNTEKEIRQRVREGQSVAGLYMEYERF
ncbi:MAG: RraA family protein [Clostridia bacterium]|nr:RraA family protein [Clostridia bacterium]